MKLPFHYIAILVVLSLSGIFVYQGYWLVTMYHTLGKQAEVTIGTAIKNADHIELFMRADSLSKKENKFRKTGASVSGDMEISFSTSFEKKDAVEYRKSITKKKITKDGKINISEESVQKGVVQRDKGQPLIGEDISSLYTLASDLQRGLHGAIDDNAPISLAHFDSILHHELLKANLNIGHYTVLMNVKTDSILSSSLPASADTTQMKRHTYNYYRDNEREYRVYTDPTERDILQQMSGILATSLVILLILGFSFWYLIRTILQQKTLEEMTSDFTNNITHELKTPIAVAYAANDALLNFNQAEEKSKRDTYLTISQQQLQRLSGLVEQILSMSMERRKTFRLHPERIALGELLMPLVELHKLKGEGALQVIGDPPKSITPDIHYSILPDNLYVTADRTHLSNIISNLIDNAVKYSPGKADISIRCRKVEKRIEISVSDRGIGITEEQQKHVFEKFYRVSTRNLHDVKGYGLGLYYVKTMVEQHGGKVQVRSVVGEGSTFTITL